MQCHGWGFNMTSTISEDALRGQQSRIMKAMRAATQPQQGSDLRDIASALTTQNQGGANYFDTMKKLGQEQAQTAMNAEMGIYEQMKEQVARGDAEAKGVDDAINEVAGGDPKIYASVLEALHSDPEPVNARNAKSKVMKHAAELGINPLSVQEAKAKIAKTNADALNISRGGDKPSLVKTMEAYKSASPEERAIMDRFGKVYEKNTYMDDKGNIVPLPGSPEAIEALAKSKASGTATGKSNAEFVAKAQQNLPTVLDNAEYLNSQLDDVLNHPGKKYAVGASSALPVVPGTPAADFKARLDQINGAAFLQAFDVLRGAGQITEIEGEKATKARNRMQRAQSEADFDTAAKEYKSIIKQATKRAIDAARGKTVGLENVDRNIENIPTGDTVTPKKVKFDDLPE